MRKLKHQSHIPVGCSCWRLTLCRGQMVKHLVKIISKFCCSSWLLMSWALGVCGIYVVETDDLWLWDWQSSHSFRNWLPARSCVWYVSWRWNEGPRWQSGNTLAYHLWGRGSIPAMASSGKAASCLPLVGSLQYRTLTNCMYWFPLPFPLVSTTHCDMACTVLKVT